MILELTFSLIVSKSLIGPIPLSNRAYGSTRQFDQAPATEVLKNSTLHEMDIGLFSNFYTRDSDCSPIETDSKVF